MRVAQMGMGVVTVAAQRGNFTGNGLGGDGRVGDRDGADGGGDEEQRCADLQQSGKARIGQCAGRDQPHTGRGDQRRKPARGVLEG